MPVDEEPGFGDQGWWRQAISGTPFLFLGFMGFHALLNLLYFLALQLRNAQFFGVKVQVTDSIITGVFYAILRNTTWKVLPFALLFSFLAAFICGAPAPKSGKLSRTGWTVVGLLLYFLFSLLLILPRPGSFASLPLIRLWPYWACYLFFLTLFAATIYLMPTSHFRKALLILLIVTLELIPHHALRSLWYRLYPTRIPGGGRVLMLSLDSARLDEVRQHLPAGHVTYSGLSEFQSTRRQWSVMLGDDPAKVENKLFLPSLQEKMEPIWVSDFEQDVRTNRYTMAFLLDDGGTANRQGLPLGLSEVHINGEGLDLAGAPAYFPLAAWLQNILAPVEANNAFSDIDAFLADTIEALRRNDAVLAHTCYLEQTLATVSHFYRFQGLGWLSKSPIDFAFGGARLATHRGVSPRDISSFKTRVFLEKATSLFATISAKYPDYSGLLTSDHGEDFDAISGEPLLSIHGFSASPGCAWIPIVPFGRTTITSECLTVPPTWKNLHESLRACLLDHGIWVVRNSASKQWSAFPFIVPPLLPWDPKDQNVLTMQEISRNTFFTPPLGLYLKPAKPIDQYKKSYITFSPGTGLFTLNPTLAGGYRLQIWDGYDLIKQVEIPPQLAGLAGLPRPRSFPVMGRPAATIAPGPFGDPKR